MKRPATPTKNPEEEKDAVLKTCEYALYRRCIEGTNAVDIQKTRRSCENCEKKKKDFLPTKLPRGYRVSGTAEHAEDMAKASDRRVYILVAVVTQS
jgi:hypothetical protein